MARRLQQTLADYVVIAISPALIMTLIGSLVFFLITVFYQGEFVLRLHWVMACFVFAAVLIGRVSIEEGLERAIVLGIALAIVVALAMNKFVEVQGGWIGQFGWIINWGLIALVWWCAHKLTWDCTVIDDSQDASGQGLLQVAGFEQAKGERDEAGNSAGRALEGTTSRHVPAGWWQRHVEHQHRPHAPGVWVVYFSLAALPLFGLGQWLIPASATGSRRYAFWLLSLYVASGMGLLLTTSFLGLRRYLRQRRIEMPTLMANLWLGTGAVVILLLLVIAALLPRPSAEYSISRLPFSVGSPGGRSSSMAPTSKEGADDEQQGTAPNQRPAGDDGSESQGEQDESPVDSASAQSDQGEAAPPAEGSSQDDSAGGSSSASEDKSGGSDANKSGGRSKSGQSQGQEKSSTSPGKQKESSTDQNSETSPQAERRARIEKFLRDRGAQPMRSKSPEETEPAESSQQPPTENDQQQAADEDPQPEQSTEPPTEPAENAESSSSFDMPSVAEAPVGILAQLFKWAFYAAFALAVVYFLWRYRAEVLAAVRDFLASMRDFWNGLWGRREAGHLADGGPVEIKVPPAPFSTFADPFATGVAARYPLEELVRYSFEAFEAWAREHGCERGPEQTPHELARDVGKLNSYMAADARQLAELFARVAYARGELPDTARQQLQELWQVMRQSTVERR